MEESLGLAKATLATWHQRIRPSGFPILWMTELDQGFAIYRNKKEPRNKHAALKRTG